MNWEKRILKSLNSMCTELGVPLAKRVSSEQNTKMKLCSFDSRVEGYFQWSSLFLLNLC